MVGVAQMEVQSGAASQDCGVLRWHHREMLSFIVPAHDEARLIAETLRALHAAASAIGVAYEIVVVDDASADGTGDIAVREGARVLRVECRHIAATRNAGAQAAAGETLVFVDADTLVDPVVLRAALQALETGAVAGGARVRLLGPLSWFESALQTLFAWIFRVTGIAPGCFIFCRREAFEAVGGFDEAWYAGEDVAISRAFARHGRFVILRESVFTSARKLHSFSVREQLGLLWRFVWRGRRMLRSRAHLDLWYGKRRD